MNLSKIDYFNTEFTFIVSKNIKILSIWNQKCIDWWWFARTSLFQSSSTTSCPESSRLLPDLRNIKKKQYILVIRLHVVIWNRKLCEGRERKYTILEFCPYEKRVHKVPARCLSIFFYCYRPLGNDLFLYQMIHSLHSTIYPNLVWFGYLRKFLEN